MGYKNSIFNVFETHNSKEYLVNTFSQSVVMLLPEEAERIKELLKLSSPENEKEEEYIRVLVENDFLVPTEKNELSWLEYRYNKRWFDSEQLNLLFLPTLRCNFSCPYCFESEKDLDMDERRLEVFIQWLTTEMVIRKTINISFFGGEPLLKLPYVEKICTSLNAKAKETKCTLFYSLVSNAYLLTEPVAKTLLLELGFRGFQITFDGPAAFHDKRRKMHSGAPTFASVLANTKMLMRIAGEYAISDMALAIRVNYDDETLEDIEEFLRLFSDEEKKLCTIYFRKLYNTDRWASKAVDRIELRTLYGLAKSYGFTLSTMVQSSFVYCECDGGEGQLTVLPDLSVWKCANDYSYKEARVGCINAKTELELDEEKMMCWGEKNPFKDERCRACAYVPICVGSCPLAWSKERKRTCFCDKANLVDVLLVNNEI